MTDLERRAIEEAKHAIGIGQHGRNRPYKRHGRLFYRPWRNRFCTAVDDPVWVYLKKLGYAEHGEVRTIYKPDATSTIFYLTRNGLDWIGKQIGVIIHDESD